MDKEAVSNRCLWDVTGLASSRCETVGDVACGRRVRVPFSDSIQGYQWLARHLRQMDFSPPSTADFKSYATRWEGRYSAIIPDRTAKLTLVPVVDATPFFSHQMPIIGIPMSMFPVIAHHGRVHVGNIIVPRKLATNAVSVERIKALQQLLDQDIAAYVEEGYPAAGDWGAFAESHNVGPNFFTVLTDPEGRILASLNASGSEPGLESEDPISYLMVAAAVLGLATAGGRLVLRMIAQRAARKAAAAAAVTIPEGEVYLAAVRNGEVIGWTANSGLGHEVWIERTFRWTVKTVPKDITVVSVGKHGGEIVGILSGSVHGSPRLAPFDVLQVLKKFFR